MGENDRRCEVVGVFVRWKRRGKTAVDKGKERDGGALRRVGGKGCEQLSQVLHQSCDLINCLFKKGFSLISMVFGKTVFSWQAGFLFLN